MALPQLSKLLTRDSIPLPLNIKSPFGDFMLDVNSSGVEQGVGRRRLKYPLRVKMLEPWF